MSVPQIMTASFEDLLPVVIIISVIVAKLVKATRKGGAVTPSQPIPGQPAAPRAPASSPGDELRQFLEALGGAPANRTATPPPPPMPVQRPVIRNRAVRAAYTAAPPRSRPAPAAVAAPPPPQPKPAPRRKYWQPAPVVPRPVVVEACELGEARRALNLHLADRKSLRGAWLLREVLGPPVALKP